MKRLVHAVLRVENVESPELTLPPELKCLTWGDLAAVYCELPVESITPTVARLQAFARAVSEIHRTYSTVPLRFGCTVESDDELVSLLRDHRAAWIRMLDDLERCDEYSVHLPLEPRSSVAHWNPLPTSDLPCAERASDRPGTTYLMARRHSLQVASAAQKEVIARAEQLRQLFDGHYRSYEINLSASRADQLVTVVFLVPRGSTAAFLSALQAASSAGLGYLFATGPWPPYHFTAPAAELESSMRDQS